MLVPTNHFNKDLVAVDGSIEIFRWNKEAVVEFGICWVPKPIVLYLESALLLHPRKPQPHHQL